MDNPGKSMENLWDDPEIIVKLYVKIMRNSRNGHGESVESKC